MPTALQVVIADYPLATQMRLELAYLGNVRAADVARVARISESHMSRLLNGKCDPTYSTVSRVRAAIRQCASTNGKE